MKHPLTTIEDIAHATIECFGELEGTSSRCPLCSFRRAFWDFVQKKRQAPIFLIPRFPGISETILPLCVNFVFLARLGIACGKIVLRHWPNFGEFFEDVFFSKKKRIVSFPSGFTHLQKVSLRSMTENRSILNLEVPAVVFLSVWRG